VDTRTVETADGLAEETQTAALWLRRLAVLALAGLVGVSLFGLLGVRTAEVAAEDQGYHLQVRYPEVARAGLDATYEITVVRESGHTQELELAVTGSYFDLFEAQAFHPEPTEATRDGDTLYLTFATQPGSDTFMVAFDAYIQPASQRGQSATVSVMEADHELVSVSYRTRLLP
jgi:hypothetical protein